MIPAPNRTGNTIPANRAQRTEPLMVSLPYLPSIYVSSRRYRKTSPQMTRLCKARKYHDRAHPLNPFYGCSFKNKVATFSFQDHPFIGLEALVEGMPFCW
jgi:hypothetical protein